MSFIEPGLFDMIMRLRGRGISDTRVLRAMEQIPRSAFIDTEYRMQSYDEEELPIVTETSTLSGQCLHTPMTTAIMCQALDISQSHKVLHIGTGSGYMAALLAKLCTRVYSVERDKLIVEHAEENLRPLVNNVVLRHGDGRFGWRGQAPFDRIIMSVSVRVMPEALLDQLKSGGRMVAVVDDTLSYAVKKGSRVKETGVIKLDVPTLIPGKA
jgi:protein-L-isoaspartate(D-aspartate) O-methyltransferase